MLVSVREYNDAQDRKKKVLSVKELRLENPLRFKTIVDNSY